MRRPSTPAFCLFAVLTSTFIVTACGDGAGPTPRLTGSYSLLSANALGLPALYACGSSVSSGTLAIASDSVVLHVTTGQGSDVGTMEARGSYTLSPDGKRLVISRDVPDRTDTVTV